MKALLWASLALTLAACGASTTVTRKLPAQWQAPPQTAIALVSVDVPKKVMERAPNDFSNMRGVLASALAAALGAEWTVQDRTDLGYRMVIAPYQKEAKKLWIFTEEQEPTLPEDQIWAAKEPTGLPNGVQEPLVLGIRVLNWTIRSAEVGSGKSTKWVDAADVDLVYSLWRRGGKEIETVRVHIQQSGEFMELPTIRMLPARNHALTPRIRPKHVPMSAKRDQIMRTAVENSVTWYTWPMLAHEEQHGATWHVADDKYEPGVAQANQGKWDEAFAVFKALADADPNAAPAWYNMGVVRDVQGKDEEAAGYLERAAVLDDRLLYRGLRDAVKNRIANRQALVD